MTDDHEITEGSEIFRHTHLARKCGIDRITGLKGKIHSLMTTAATDTELTSIIYRALERTVILVKTVYQPDRPLRGQVGLFYAVRIGRGLVPMLVKHSGHLLESGSLVIAPCIVSTKDDLYIFICRVKSINDIRRRRNQ